MFLLILANAQSQFQSRYNFNYAIPQLRNEQFNSGIKTWYNYAAGNPVNFYYAGIGTSYNNTALPAPDNIANRMRFTTTTSNGVTVVNKGYEFLIGNNASLHSAGNSVAELNNGAGNGGYIAVGAVSDNTITKATVAGGSDILISRIDVAGVVIIACRIDLGNSNDVAWSVKRSKVNAAGGAPTWLICGQSTNVANNSTNCFVARVLSNGSIVWCKRYIFPAANGNAANSIAKQLCEDANNNIYVVGTWQDAAANVDGLAFKLNPAGAMLWAKNYHVSADDKFEAVRLTNAGNSIIVGGKTFVGGIFNMFLVQINTANGVQNFSNILRAQDAMGNTYPSSCHDIVQTPAGEYFLAGYYIKNGNNIQMMYKASVMGAGINWYSYNKMLNKVGFGIDYVNGMAPGIAFFSSLKNPQNPGFSDAHIMKTELSGNTCPSFCNALPPSTVAINVQNAVRICNETKAGTRAGLTPTSYTYDQSIICTGACNQQERIVAQPKLANTSISSGTASITTFPNPVTNLLNVKLNAFPTGEYAVTLVTVDGKIILQKKIIFNAATANINLDMSSYSPGLYIITIKRENFMLQQKIVKQ